MVLCVSYILKRLCPEKTCLREFDKVRPKLLRSQHELWHEIANYAKAGLLDYLQSEKRRQSSDEPRCVGYSAPSLFRRDIKQVLA